MAHIDARPLVPLAAPLKVTPGDYTAKEPVTLCIKERFLSIHGTDFPIIDAASGEKMFEVHGSPITFHDHKTFKSADGKTRLFQVSYHREEHNTFIGERLDIFDAGIIFTDPMAPIFMVEEAKGAKDGITMKAQVCIPHVETGRSTYGPKLALVGPFDNPEGAPIIDVATGNSVAIIRRTHDEAIGKLVQAGDPEVYFVTIATGMDIACMAGIVVCFDELHNNVKHKHTPK